MAAGAAVVAAIANATKASGVVVRVSTGNFLAILERIEAPLVVHASGGVFSTSYQYLTSYKGLAFYVKSREPIPLPTTTELVRAKSIWMPG
ncbi:MAG: hypothetical protein LC785_11660 [Acidobacteria bacterium]|nr:hypothetical protein [Acidobacteriota bacterium]MCA1642582.1 hypothetical protein [Acidobacteriota bacterium]